MLLQSNAAAICLLQLFSREVRALFALSCELVFVKVVVESRKVEQGHVVKSKGGGSSKRDEGRAKFLRKDETAPYFLVFRVILGWAND